jgi:hypothetical protein
MRDEKPDAARRAVEELAAAVAPPKPPADLRARASRRAWPLALAAVLAIAAAGWLLLRGGGGPAGPGRASGPAGPGGAISPPGVVVEHLRLAGQPVATRVEAVPGSGAVVVIATEAGSGRAPQGDAPRGGRS